MSGPSPIPSERPTTRPQHMLPRTMRVPSLLLVLASLLLMSGFSGLGAAATTASLTAAHPGPSPLAPWNCATLRVHLGPAGVDLSGVGQTEAFAARDTCGAFANNATSNSTWAWTVTGGIGTLNVTGGLGNLGAYVMFTATATGTGTIFANATWVNSGGTSITGSADTTISVGNPDLTCADIFVDLIPAAPGGPGASLTIATGTSQPFYASTLCFTGMGAPTNVTQYSNYTFYASPGIGTLSGLNFANATFTATNPGTGIVAVNATYNGQSFSWVTSNTGGGPKLGETPITTTGPAELAATASARPMTGYAPLTVAFTGGATGGTPPYTTWSWTFGNGAISAVQSPTYTYTTPGTYVAFLNVTDSASTTAMSGPVRITVDPGLTVSASSNVTSGTAPLVVGFTATAAGGAPGGDTYLWHLGNGAAPTTAAATGTYATPGTYYVWVNATDTEPVTAMSNVLVVTVRAVGPLTASAVATPSSITLGASTSVVGTLSGGGGTLTTVWTAVPPGCSAPAALTFTCTPDQVGSFTFTLHATDSLGGSAWANATLTVSPGTGTTTLAIVDVSPTTTSVSPSATQVFVASGEASSGNLLFGITYTWSVAPAGLGTLNATGGDLVVFTAGSATGTGSVWVNGTLAGVTHGAWASISVEAGAGSGAPVITGFTVGPNPVQTGASVTLTTTATGGTAPLSYAYTGLPAGCTSSNAASFSCSPTTKGNYTIVVTVTDAAGKTATSSAPLQVTPAPVTTPGSSGKSSPSWLQSNWEWLALAVAVVAAALIAVLLLARRKKGAGPAVMSTTAAGGGAPTYAATGSSDEPAPSPEEDLPTGTKAPPPSDEPPVEVEGDSVAPRADGPSSEGSSDHGGASDADSGGSDA